MRLAQGVCAGWSEPLLVPHITLLEISFHGSFVPAANFVPAEILVLEANFVLAGIFVLAEIFVPAANFVLAEIFVLAEKFLPAANFVLAEIFMPAEFFMLAGMFVPAAIFVLAANFVLAEIFVPAANFVPAAFFVLAENFVLAANFVLAGIFVPEANFVLAAIFVLAGIFVFCLFCCFTSPCQQLWPWRDGHFTLSHLSWGSLKKRFTSISSWERECFTRDRVAAGSSPTGDIALCPKARRIYPSLVLIQPRKTRPYITERLLMGRNESNQTSTSSAYFRLKLTATSRKGVI